MPDEGKTSEIVIFGLVLFAKCLRSIKLRLHYTPHSRYTLHLYRDPPSLDSWAVGSSSLEGLYSAFMASTSYCTLFSVTFSPLLMLQPGRQSEHVSLSFLIHPCGCSSRESGPGTTVQCVHMVQQWGHTLCTSITEHGYQIGS